MDAVWLTMGELERLLYLERLAEEAERAEGANPYGCNRYGHYCPQKGTTREGETRPHKVAITREESYVPAELPVVAIDDVVHTERDMEAALRGLRGKMSAVLDSRRVENGYGGSIAPGMDIPFYVTGQFIGECKNKVGESADAVSHYTAAAHVDVLWEHSVPLAEEDDRYNKPEDSDIKKVYKRTARMRIKDQIYSVKITAKVNKDEEVLPIFYAVKTEKSGQKNGAVPWMDPH